MADDVFPTEHSRNRILGKNLRCFVKNHVVKDPGGADQADEAAQIPSL